MATFFDPSSNSDRNLLPADVRESDELFAVAGSAEADVLGLLTAHGRHIPVGFSPDPEQAEGALREALRRAIAKVVGHRLRYLGSEAGVTSESRGSRSISYARATDPEWPLGWETPLIRYMQPVYAI